MDNYVRVLETLGQGLGHPVRSVHQGPQEQVNQKDSCHACAERCPQAILRWYNHPE